MSSVSANMSHSRSVMKAGYGPLTVYSRERHEVGVVKTVVREGVISSIPFYTVRWSCFPQFGAKKGNGGEGMGSIEIEGITRNPFMPYISSITSMR